MYNDKYIVFNWIYLIWRFNLIAEIEVETIDRFPKSFHYKGVNLKFIMECTKVRRRDFEHCSFKTRYFYN